MRRANHQTLVAWGTVTFSSSPKLSIHLATYLVASNVHPPNE